MVTSLTEETLISVMECQIQENDEFQLEYVDFEVPKKVDTISRQSSTLAKLLNTGNNKPIANCNKSISVFSSLNTLQHLTFSHSFLKSRALHL